MSTLVQPDCAIVLAKDIANRTNMARAMLIPLETILHLMILTQKYFSQWDEYRLLWGLIGK